MKPIYFFYILFAITLYWILYLYYDFLMNIVIAGLLCISTYGTKSYIQKYVKTNALASFLAVLLLVIFILVPLYFVIDRTLTFINTTELHTLNIVIESIKAKILNMVNLLPVDASEVQAKINSILSNINAKNIISYGFEFSALVGKASVKFVIDIGLILMFLFFSFYYARSFSDFIIRILPLETDQTTGIFNEVSGVLRVVFYTSIINMLLQGTCFGLIATYFGYDGLIFGVLYGICCIIPLVGGTIIWLPISLYTWYLGDGRGAIIIALYSMIFIGFIIDNVVKPMIISLINKRILGEGIAINDLLIFFSIIAGLSAFGFWGIVIGPTITALFIALLRLYELNLSHKFNS